MPYFKTDDAVQLYYEEKGEGQPVHCSLLLGVFLIRAIPTRGPQVYEPTPARD